jgi:hypothetical protein
VNADQPSIAVRVVAVSIDVQTDTLVVFDAHRGPTWACRVTAATTTASARPARRPDRQDGKRIAGELTCSCPAGVFARRCYWTQLADALEKGDRGFALTHPDPDPDDIAWMRDAAPGEVMEAWGK